MKKTPKQAGVIVAVGGIKGGVGKTTLSVNLAACAAQDGFDVLVIETDHERRNVERWCEARQSAQNVPHITQARKTGRIGKDLLALADKYDVVIVDLGGYLSVEFTQAARVCHRLITPTEMSAFNEDTFEDLAGAIEGANADRNTPLSAYVIPARARGQAREANLRDLRSIFDGVPELTAGDHQLNSYVAYQDAEAAGLGIIELPNRDTPTQKAQRQLRALYQEVFLQ